MPTDDLTPEEAQRAYDDAVPVPLSEERISEIVRYATGTDADREAIRLAAEVGRLRQENERLREALGPFADHWRHINESRQLNNKHGWDWPYPVGDDESTSVYVSTVRRAAVALEGRTDACHAQRDGDCTWQSCPQNRDGEPGKSGRHCPLDPPADDPHHGS